jgi:hypothetical protein
VGRVFVSPSAQRNARSNNSPTLGGKSSSNSDAGGGSTSVSALFFENANRRSAIAFSIGMSPTPR